MNGKSKKSNRFGVVWSSSLSEGYVAAPAHTPRPTLLPTTAKGGDGGRPRSVAAFVGFMGMVLCYLQHIFVWSALEELRKIGGEHITAQIGLELVTDFCCALWCTCCALI